MLWWLVLNNVICNSSKVSLHYVICLVAHLLQKLIISTSQSQAFISCKTYFLWSINPFHTRDHFRHITSHIMNILEKYLIECCSECANNKLFWKSFFESWAGFTESQSVYYVVCLVAHLLIPLNNSFYTGVHK